MANEAHLSLLKQGAKAWNDMLRQRMGRADLFVADLRGAVLFEANLSGVDLTGADLRGAVLFEANLTGADLRKAILFKVDLFEANLTGADLTGADLRKANLFKAILFETNLTGVDLRKAILFKAKLSNANLSEADLAGADLRKANLFKANLFETNLTGADLRKANLFKANLSNANLSGADLAGADLSGANLSGANMTEADLTGADPPGADLSGAISSWASLTGADLSEASLPKPDELQESGRKAVLSLGFLNDQTVQQFATLLASLHHLYRDDIKLDQNIDLFQYEAPPLKIRSLHISSPGLLEVVGALNPLTFIYKMTQLILNHIAETEKRRLSEEELRLKNAKLKLAIVDKKFELLKKFGISQEKIREGITSELLGENVSLYSEAVERARVVSVNYSELSYRGDQLAARG